MLHLTYTDTPDSLEYYNNISVDRNVYFDIRKVGNTIELEKAMAETDKELSIDALQVGCEEGNMYLGDLDKYGGSQISREIIMYYLKQEVGSRQYLLQTYDKRSGSKYSLNMDMVLMPLLEKGYAEEFLDTFISFRKHNKAAKDMRKRVDERFVNTTIKGVSSLGYKWNKALTGRYYTEDENIQNINKLYLDSMRSVNDDYLLVWGDFDQIDLRVAYYTVISESEEDNEIFSKYDDKYEALARIIDRKLGRKFNIENFLANRSKYKRGILARCYGQTLKRLIQTVRDKEFAKMLDKYFLENKRYSKWYDSVNVAISNNNTLDIYTYFGNTCHISYYDCVSTEQKLDRTLNCPIQGTSNDIVMHTVNKTVAEFRRAGVSEDKFRVYMVRHDEPIYMIHKSVLKYLPIIKQNTVVQIDEWGPITMSMDIGKYYTISEKDKYSSYFGDDILTKCEVITSREDEYNPLRKQYVKSAETIKVHGNILRVGSKDYELSKTKHKQFQIHNILSEYAIDKKITTVVFDIESSDIKLYDVFVGGVYMYFNNLGGE